ncbi:hypothetical protein CASFOL_003972 [Castilleja foliolosa]|uniref:ELM2 domain-containing protein n=1 Tax=Castilleja foliolosa TaxID=1961234 RepID=A0ABD3EJ43_9LAMI
MVFMGFVIFSRMGVKRPLVEENLPELYFKQPKQLDDNNQMLTHDLPIDVPIIDCPGEAKSVSCVVQANERLGSGEALCASTADNKSEKMEDRVENLSETEQHIQLDENIIKLHVDGPLYWTTTISDTEDDAVLEDSASPIHTFPRYADSLSSRPPQHLEDPYVSLLNSSPTKEVPVGPDHQAELPDWDPRYFSAPNHQTGHCIIPMPDLNISGTHESIVGSTHCSCVDVGSARCARRHISEARNNLHESLGDEIFGELGFYSMGEEVAHKWASEDQHLFHETIVSNPPSYGPDFWEKLGFYFPNRTKDEIVSYYFNVFMLRWRAVQNRSYLLRADSDDEETAHGEQCAAICLHGDRLSDDYNNKNNRSVPTEEFYGVGEGDEWGDDQDLFAGWVDECGPEPRNVSDIDCARVNIDKGGTGKGGLF